MTDTRGAVFLRNSNLIAENVGNEVIVYDTETSNAISLNKISAAILELCNGKCSPKDIAEKLNKKFDRKVDEQLVELILVKFVEQNLAKPQAGQSLHQSVG